MAVIPVIVFVAIGATIDAIASIAVGVIKAVINLIAVYDY